MMFVTSLRTFAAVAALVVVLPATIAAQSPPPAAPPGAVPLATPLPLQQPVQDKNFYLLSLIERTPAVAQAVKSEPELAALFKARLGSLEYAETKCTTKPFCPADAVRLYPADIDAAAQALGLLYDREQAVRDMVAGPMRQSGLFVLYRDEDDKTLLVHAWRDAAQGLNRILDVYGKGAKPHYDLIDSATFDLRFAPEYWTAIHGVVGELHMPEANLFFEPSLRFSLMLLQLNHRDEAGRFEPLDRNENGPTIAHLPSVRWSDFPYTAILALGAGPEDPNLPLSAMGRVIVAQAAELFRQGKAPLIITSGGFVHPSQTRYSEAIEMRRALIEQYGIPANVILIDPHARHTTTNFRNADRLIYRYGIPFDRPAIAETIAIDGIMRAAFDQRNMTELGYLPYRDKTRVSASVVSFYPTIDALQGDARDPLDP